MPQVTDSGRCWYTETYVICTPSCFADIMFDFKKIEGKKQEIPDRGNPGMEKVTAFFQDSLKMSIQPVTCPLFK